jgi:SAM-dependent methyltransferase
MKDNFSQGAAAYAQYRPTYPGNLFAFILSYVKEKGLAWDCGTGNGQSARVLSKYFKKVFATDISQAQINNAHQEMNIVYAIEPAEKTSLADRSVDLVTVAQAIHWFNFEKFYAEVNRVAKPGAVIAVWTYSLLHISEEIDAVINEYYAVTLAGFWDPERTYVDERYETIPFPFTKIPVPDLKVEVEWTLEELSGYLNTWSALKKFIQIKSYDPVPAVINKIKPLWGGLQKRKIFFPVYLKLGIIE